MNQDSVRKDNLMPRITEPQVRNALQTANVSFNAHVVTTVANRANLTGNTNVLEVYQLFVEDSEEIDYDEAFPFEPISRGGDSIVQTDVQYHGEGHFSPD
jgi:hypothetical protein